MLPFAADENLKQQFHQIQEQIDKLLIPTVPYYIRILYYRVVIIFKPLTLSR